MSRRWLNSKGVLVWISKQSQIIVHIFFPTSLVKSRIRMFLGIWMQVFVWKFGSKRSERIIVPGTFLSLDKIVRIMMGQTNFALTIDATIFVDIRLGGEYVVKSKHHDDFNYVPRTFPNINLWQNLILLRNSFKKKFFFCQLKTVSNSISNRFFPFLKISKILTAIKLKSSLEMNLMICFRICLQRGSLDYYSSEKVI